MEELLRILVEETLKVVLGIASILLAIIAFVQRYQFNNFRKKVAIEQGVFKKPLLSLGMFGKFDTSTFILAIPLAKHIWEIPLIFNIYNVGDKTAEEIEIFYRTNKDLCYGGVVKPQIENPGIKNAKVSQMEETGPFITVISSLDNIHQKQKISFNVLSSFRSATIFPHDIEATTKDGVNVTIKTWLNIGFPLDLVVSQKEFEPCSKRFTIQVVDTSNTNVTEFFTKYNLALKQNREKKSTELPLFTRIRNNLSKGNPPKKISLISFDTHKKSINTLRDKGKKVRLYEIPVDALQVQDGLEFEEEYFIPNVTHEIVGNRLTTKSSRSTSSGANN